MSERLHENLQSAFLLHSRPYKENQLLLDFISEYDGKVSAVTYVSHSTKSNKKALLQPFLPLKISYKGKSSLKSLTLVEATGKPYVFKGNYLYSGFYLNELMVRLLTELLPCNEVFNQYQLSLHDLSLYKSIEVVLRYFEMTLLEELGQTIDFSVLLESTNEPVSYFYYQNEQGFIPAFNHVSHVCYSKQHLLSIAQQDLSNKEVLYTFKLLMRQIMAPLLGNKPLNSRKFFKQR